MSTLPTPITSQIVRAAEMAAPKILGAAGVASAIATVYSMIPKEAKEKVLSWMKRATGGKVATPSDVANYAGRSIANKAVVAEALVRAGAHVDMVAGLFRNDAGFEQITVSLRNLAANLGQQVDGSRAGTPVTNEDSASDVLRAELVKTLVRQFGSTANARRVQVALASIRSEDLDWYDALHQQFRG